MDKYVRLPIMVYHGAYYVPIEPKRYQQSNGGTVMNTEEMLELLPLINDRKEVVGKEYDGHIYRPILFFNCDSGEWEVDFVRGSCECNLEFSGKTAVETVQKAYDYFNRLESEM